MRAERVAGQTFLLSGPRVQDEPCTTYDVLRSVEQIGRKAIRFGGELA